VFEEDGGPRATARIIPLMFLVALTGCATATPPDYSSPWHWQKAGVTVEQQRRDQAECTMAADRAYNASTIQDVTLRAAASSGIAEDCFRAKGCDQ
jgi:hypothetical protein